MELDQHNVLYEMRRARGRRLERVICAFVAVVLVLLAVKEHNMGLALLAVVASIIGISLNLRSRWWK